ncbi:COG1470 family protein [Cellulomonas pakistanensis]|uniref:DUF916 domain-containing protein n=1 Tax=Cellulomonas pakistanensis TaxID=992287 RepID=A0A919PD89_9CELL|nr:DUF916 domain-containing protein [Cellulomonas pakistanensis]GIG37546.1 hypothetical protein Cpa01nite_29270 [Cellulomonas pakistanensis]
MTPSRVPAALAALLAAAALGLGASAPAGAAPADAAARAVAVRAVGPVPAVPAAAVPAAVPSAADPAADPAAPAADPAAPAAPDPSTQVTWGVRPADTVHGAERPNFAYTLPPGGTLADAIVVTNKGDAPLSLDVYAADGFLTADGTLDVLEAGEESTALGAWVRVETPEIVVQPDAAVEVPFTLTVPEDAQPGDYAAGVVSSLLVENAEGVSVDRRLGSRVHLRVSGDLAPALALSDVRVDYDAGGNPVAPGAATVSFTVTNTGNARVAPTEAVQVAGLFGWGRARAEAVEVPELIPGASVQRSVRVEGVWPLVRTSARVALGGEVVALPGAAATDAAPAVPAVAASAAAWAVPWAAVGALALVVALVALRVAAGRRRKVRHQRAVDAAVADALARQGATT